jgi:membrane protein DedA with SNARE-associated domain
MVFLARFMPGIRTVFMFTSGVMRLTYWKFIGMNLLGALIVVPSILYSVSFFVGNQGEILELLKKAQGMVLLAISLGVLGWLIRRIGENARIKKGRD